MRCATEGHNLVNSILIYLTAHAVVTETLMAQSLRSAAGVSGLAWPRHMAMLVYLRFRSGVPSNSIDCHSNKDEYSISLMR